MKSQDRLYALFKKKILKSKNYSNVETSKMDFKDTPVKIVKQFSLFPFPVNPDSVYPVTERNYLVGQ